MGEIDLAAAGFNLDAVASCHLVELSAQSLADANREKRRAIVASFATAHHDPVAIEVNVLDPQRQAFEQVASGAAISRGWRPLLKRMNARIP